MLALGCLAGLLFLAGGAETAQAEPPNNAECLLCHSQPDQTLTLPSGETLAITVIPAMYGRSVHWDMYCVDCHTGIKDYPHPENPAQNRREFALQFKETCKDCHDVQYDQVVDSIHQTALDAGNENAPACNDCHDPHTQTAIRDEQGVIFPAERLQIPRTCARCHSQILEEYAQSVHGDAILESNNTDAPTCIDCHGVHKIIDAQAAAFRLSSIQMCANCHTNPEIMDQYGLSTQVLDTYVADFHGTTAVLFESRSPDEAPNTAVCYDCHGFHDVLSVKDPQKGLQVRQNILASCQKCHPEAGLSFPDSWLSHYIPSPERYPLVYYVQLFYKVLIPLVIGGMAVFVAGDFSRRQIERRKKNAAGREEKS